MDRCDASMLQLRGAAAALKAAVDAHVAKIQAAVNQELKARLKALNAQLDALHVSASQLSAAATVCSLVIERAVELSDDELHAAHQQLRRFQDITDPYTGPAVNTLLEVVVGDVQALAKGIEPLGRVRLYVDSGRTALSGTGLKTFTESPSDGHLNGVSPNVLHIAPVDCQAHAICSLRPGDINIHATAPCNRDGLRGQFVPLRFSVTQWDTGVFNVTYTVPAPAPEPALHLVVNIAGFSTTFQVCTVACSPLLSATLLTLVVCIRCCVHMSLQVQRRVPSHPAPLLTASLVSSFKVGRGARPVALAVSEDSCYCAVTFGNHMVSVYALQLGVCVRSFGGKGASLGQFKSPRRLQFKGSRTLLIADFGNNRVQEVSVSGEPIRVIGGTLREPSAVACNGAVVVVARWLSFKDSPSPPLVMFDYVSGERLREFGTVAHGAGYTPGTLLPTVTQLFFLPGDPTRVVVAHNTWNDHRLTVLGIDGKDSTEMHRSTASIELRAAMGEGGEVAICSSTGSPVATLQLYHWAGITLDAPLRELTIRNLASVEDIAHVNGRLYALGASGFRVSVFE